VSFLCVFAVLGVFALNKKLKTVVSRKHAKDRKDAKKLIDTKTRLVYVQSSAG
jgi:hypothetical protein